MDISDFLCPKAIKSDLQSTKKEDVIEELVDLLIEAGAVQKKVKPKLVEILLAREALGSTAIGQGIAIPHGKCDQVTKLTGALGISKKGVDFDSLDGEPAHILCLLVAPMDSAGPHLKALAQISRLLKDKYFRDSLKSAPDEKTILRLVNQDNQQSV